MISRARFLIRLLTAYMATMVLLCSGCSSLTHQEFSRSVQENGQDSYIKGSRVIETPDISLHFKPDNKVRNYYRCINFVFPIPIPLGIESDRAPKQLGYKNFSVLMALKPHREGFVLDPKSVQLLVNKAIVPASGMVGPQMSSKACSEFTHANGSRFEQPTKIENNDAWICYSAFFDIPPPSPDTQIRLNILGLTLNGTPYEVPVIGFKKAEYSTNHDYGECGCSCGKE